MTKGKPWTIEEETELKALIEAKTPIAIIAEKLKKKPRRHHNEMQTPGTGKLQKHN